MLYWIDKMAGTNYFTLTYALTVADFKLRFHGSALGVFWSFLRPLMLFGVLYLVFSVFMHFNVPNYPLYLLLGTILWNFFSEATNFSLSSIESKAPLLKKVFFPRSIVVISAVATSFISLFFNLVVFFIFVMFSGPSLGLTVFLFPLYLVALFFITVGISYIIVALFAKFKDVKTIWEVLLQLGFWVTPIIYSVSMIPQRFHLFIYLNPLTRVIQYSRESVIERRVSSLAGIIALVLTAAVFFVVGQMIFNKRSGYFAEEL